MSHNTRGFESQAIQIEPRPCGQAVKRMQGTQKYQPTLPQVAARTPPTAETFHSSVRWYLDL